MSEHDQRHQAQESAPATKHTSAPSEQRVRLREAHGAGRTETEKQRFCFHVDVLKLLDLEM